MPKIQETLPEYSLTTSFGNATEVLERRSSNIDAEQAAKEFVRSIEQEDLTPGEKIGREFNKLWQIYGDRREGVTTEHGSSTLEDDILATRYHDGQAIEEIYWRSREINPANKLMQEQIFINIALEDGAEQQIYVNPAGEVAVMQHESAEAIWQLASQETRQAVLDEFEERTLIAAEKHAMRSEAEKAEADASARQLLYDKFPNLLGHKSAPIE